MAELNILQWVDYSDSTKMKTYMPKLPNVKGIFWSYLAKELKRTKICNISQFFHVLHYEFGEYYELHYILANKMTKFRISSISTLLQKLVKMKRKWNRKDVVIILMTKGRRNYIDLGQENLRGERRKILTKNVENRRIKLI